MKPKASKKKKKKGNNKDQSENKLDRDTFKRQCQRSLTTRAGSLKR